MLVYKSINKTQLTLKSKTSNAKNKTKTNEPYIIIPYKKQKQFLSPKT